MITKNNKKLQVLVDEKTFAEIESARAKSGDSASRFCARAVRFYLDSSLEGGAANLVGDSVAARVAEVAKVVGTSSDVVINEIFADFFKYRQLDYVAKKIRESQR